MKTVTVEEAQSDLQHLLEEIARGEAVVITRDGAPVARLESAAADAYRSDDDRKAAIRDLVDSLRDGEHLGGVRIKRDELYDR